MNGDINYKAPGKGDQRLTRLNYTGMYGYPAAGFYRWQIKFDASLYVSVESGAQKVALTDVKGDLFLANSDLLVARFFQTEPRSTLIGEFSDNHDAFTLEAEMDVRRLLKMGELRGGKDLLLQMKLWATAVNMSNRDRYPAKGEATITVNQSDWTTLETQMQFRRTLLVEVPVMEESKYPELAKAAGHLAHAAEQMARGYYPNAVAECRKVLELVKAKLPKAKDVLALDEKTRTKEQRFVLVNKMLFKLANLAPHADELASQTQWSPEGRAGRAADDWGAAEGGRFRRQPS